MNSGLLRDVGSVGCLRYPEWRPVTNDEKCESRDSHDFHAVRWDPWPAADNQ